MNLGKQESRNGIDRIKHLPSESLPPLFAFTENLVLDFWSPCTRRLWRSNLLLRGIAFERQKPLPLFYREHQIGEHRLDFLVEGKIIVELKAISALEDIHFAIVRSYLKAANLMTGCCLNFATAADRKARRARVPPNDSKETDLVL